VTDITAFYRRLLGAIASNTGDAYVYFNDRCSWTDLYCRMREINTGLAGKRRQRIAVYSGKSPDAYAAIFTCILSGNVWVPLNPDFPPERIVQMLRLAVPAVIVTDRPLPEAIANWVQESGVDVLDLSAPGTGPGLEFDPDAIKADDEAYIMFTSGSTGTPKGVPMTHANYIPFVDTALDILDLRCGDVFADYHDFGFDISIFYLFCCPLVGGAFAPALREVERLMPLAHIRDNKVTILASVPSILARVRAMHPVNPPPTTLRLLFLCGEPFRLELLDYSMNAMAIEQVYNFYGLTETGVENFHHRCSPDDIERFAATQYVPIGLPLPGNRFRIDAEGELWLAGPQLTPGYLGGIGTERFTTLDGERWYRTGDRVEERDGLYFCKGRLDWQVKLNGYRVELMDIEAHIRSLPDVMEAVCVVEPHQGRDFLVAVIAAGRPLESGDVRGGLKGRVPSFMLPNAVMQVEDIPLNKSGKVDRQAVTALVRNRNR
jgi:acyl-CoA synthetase (AMP-forming)/AMP-acid ligase II